MEKGRDSGMVKLEDRIRETLSEALKLRESKIELKDDDILFGEDSKHGFDSIDFLTVLSALATVFKLKVEHFTAELIHKGDMLASVQSIKKIAEWIRHECPGSE